MEHFLDAVRIKPDYAEARVNLGNALLQLGHAPQAIDHYQSAVKLLPNDRAVYVNLALACAQANRTAEAVAAAERALQLAQADGQTQIARQLETWLGTLRSQQEVKNSRPSAAPPAPKAD